MIFFYSSQAGDSLLVLTNDDYHYLVRVRRHKVADILALQDMKTAMRFWYSIQEINKKNIVLMLTHAEPIYEPKLFLHVGWAVCEASTIYETLPALNQLGVQKISFLETQRSQRNIRLNPEKIKNICINSSQQCGRNHLLEWEIISFSCFISQNPDTICFDMTGKPWTENGAKKNISTFIIGPEGGFTPKELDQIPCFHRYTFDSPFVLRSEIAVIAAATLLQSSSKFQLAA